jgi:hypothetical protein
MIASSPPTKSATCFAWFQRTVRDREHEHGRLALRSCSLTTGEAMLLQPDLESPISGLSPMSMLSG